MMNFERLLKKLIIVTVTVLLICMVVVIIIDPFFHYHKPVLGLKAVLNEKEYQCIGTLRTFDYDSVIVGSSVCENYNNRWFNDEFGVNSIKAVRSYGGTADLIYYLNTAFDNNDIKKVFYNIDPPNLSYDPYLSFEETGCPMYLYDNNPFNDIEYLLNKDVIFEKIPYMLTKSFIGDYDEGESYSWGQWKEFDTASAIGNSIRTCSFLEEKQEDYYKEQCDANIKLIEDVVIAHPNTEFYFFIPPYSFLWWDNVYRLGNKNAFVYNLKRVSESLIKYDNVHMFSFIDDEEIVVNLENYMDSVHFSPEINQEIVSMLKDESLEINANNIDERFSYLSEYVDKAVFEYIKPYEDQIVVEIPQE